jgi:hypothetical protein
MDATCPDPREDGRPARSMTHKHNGDNRPDPARCTGLALTIANVLLGFFLFYLWSRALFAEA